MKFDEEALRIIADFLSYIKSENNSSINIKELERYAQNFLIKNTERLNAEKLNKRIDK